MAVLVQHDLGARLEAKRRDEVRAALPAFMVEHPGDRTLAWDLALARAGGVQARRLVQLRRLDNGGVASADRIVAEFQRAAVGTSSR